MLFKRTLHQREASLLRCAALVRRASCGLQRAIGCRVPRWHATALAVSREEAQHSSLTHVRAMPCWVLSTHAL